MAQGLLGTLAVNVVAKTEKFTAGMKKSQKGLKSFTRQAKSSIGTLGKLAGVFTGLGAVGGVAGFVQSMRSSSDAIDRLAKDSAKLGVTTEQLGALHHAAKLNGIEANAFTTSLQRMTRRVSEAANGSGVLVKVLDDMGIDAKELNKLDPAAQFARINAALGQVPKSDRIRTAFAFFDSDGVNNIRLAGQNLTTYADEASRLGILVTQGQAKDIERMNDSFERVGKAFKGVSNRIVIALAPGVAEVMEGFTLYWQAQERKRKGKLRRQGRNLEGASQDFAFLGENVGGFMRRVFVGGSPTRKAVERDARKEIERQNKKAANDPRIQAMLFRERVGPAAMDAMSAGAAAARSMGPLGAMMNAADLQMEEGPGTARHKDAQHQEMIEAVKDAARGITVVSAGIAF